MLSIRKSIARPSSWREKYVYLVDVLSFAQKVRKLFVAMKLFPLVLKTLSKRSWSFFLSWACGIQPRKITERRVVLCSSILEKIIYMRFSSGVRKLSVIWVSVLSGCLGFHCIRLSPFKLLKTWGCLQLEEQNSVTN